MGGVITTGEVGFVETAAVIVSDEGAVLYQVVVEAFGEMFLLATILEEGFPRLQH
jgi:hypothetical protein